jgi:hypothetical protein
MILLLIVVLVSIGVPVSVDYWRAPKENILTRSRNDAIQGVTHVVNTIERATWNQMAEHPLLEGLPSWIRNIFLKVLKMILSLLR